MIKLTDQIGHTVTLANTPQRIVSLVPSQTELLFDIGLAERVVGITKFCVHPTHWRKTKTVVGGTKKINHAKIAALKPDLIIANKEENTKDDILELQKKYPVYTSDILTLDSSFRMMQNLGMLLDKVLETSTLIAEIKESFGTIKAKNQASVAYVIWQNPLMLAGRNTFINSLLAHSGFKNILSEELSRYPELTFNELIKLNPDYLFLSSEPFPFKEKHKAELQKATKIKTVLVDGEMFSWYGSRMKKFAAYINDLHLKA